MLILSFLFFDSEALFPSAKSKKLAETLAAEKDGEKEQNESSATEEVTAETEKTSESEKASETEIKKSGTETCEGNHGADDGT